MYLPIYANISMQRVLKDWVNVFPETEIKLLAKLIPILVEAKSN